MVEQWPACRYAQTQLLEDHLSLEIAGSEDRVPPHEMPPIHMFACIQGSRCSCNRPLTATGWRSWHTGPALRNLVAQQPLPLRPVGHYACTYFWRWVSSHSRTYVRLSACLYWYTEGVLKKLMQSCIRSHESSAHLPPALTSTREDAG